MTGKNIKEIGKNIKEKGKNITEKGKSIKERIKKRKAESKKYLPGKDGCFKQKLAKTATISPAICK